MSSDPWQALQTKMEKVRVISERRKLNLHIQIFGVFVLFILQGFGYLFKVDPNIMVWYPLVFVVWGLFFILNSLRYGRQIQKIIEAEE